MSFAAEVKEFISSYSAVRELGEKSAQRKQDKEYNDAILELKRAEQALDEQALELRRNAAATRGTLAPSPSEVRAQTRFDWEAEDRARAADEEAAAADAEAAISAIDVGGFDTSDVPVEDTAKYAEGGLVDEPESALPVEDMRAPVRPKPRPAALAPEAPAVQEAPAQPAMPPAKPTRIVVQRAAEVGKEVMDNVAYELKTPESAVGEGSGKSGADFVSGRGGMTPQEITALEQKIDPEGTIAPHVKTAVTMAEVHNHFIEKGEPEKALKASVGYLTGIKGLTQTLGTLSMQAAQAGDPEAACRLANDACNRFPSEHIVNFSPDPRFGFTYSVTDADGKTVDQGRMNPNQFLETTGKIANGQAFTNQMFQFVTRHKESGGDFGKALSGIEQAAGRLAGIEEAFSMKEEGDEGYAEGLAARKEALAALQQAEAAARELADLSADPKKRRSTEGTANIENSIRAARKAGKELAIPFEAPAQESVPDDRNWWERNMPTAVGGQEAPTAAPAATAVPTTPPAPPATQPGNTPPAAKLPAGMTAADVVAQAKTAIAGGKDPDAIAARLKSFGIDPSLLAGE
jgi:hypothetical protein